jgi:hypothetical protein
MNFCFLIIKLFSFLNLLCFSWLLLSSLQLKMQMFATGAWDAFASQRRFAAENRAVANARKAMDEAKAAAIGPMEMPAIPETVEDLMTQLNALPVRMLRDRLETAMKPGDTAFRNPSVTVMNFVIHGRLCSTEGPVAATYVSPNMSRRRADYRLICGWLINQFASDRQIPCMLNELSLLFRLLVAHGVDLVNEFLICFQLCDGVLGELCDAMLLAGPHLAREWLTYGRMSWHSSRMHSNVVVTAHLNRAKIAVQSAARSQIKEQTQFRPELISIVMVLLSDDDLCTRRAAVEEEPDALPPLESESADPLSAAPSDIAEHSAAAAAAVALQLPQQTKRKARLVIDLISDAAEGTDLVVIVHDSERGAKRMKTMIVVE